LVRVSGGSIVAGSAAFAMSFISYMWLTHDAGPAIATVRGDAVYSGDTIAAPALHYSSRDYAAALEAVGNTNFALRWPENPSDPMTPHSSFDERFAFDPPGAPVQSAQASVSFDDRFNPGASAPDDAVRSAAATVPARRTSGRAAKTIPAPRAVAQTARKQPQKGSFQLASASATSLPLAYAPDESAKTLDKPASLQRLDPKDANPIADLDASHTAIYDITSRTVYLPNGRRLEAHSGLGGQMDDPRYVAVKHSGPTPPNVYELRMRESLFHGVRAIRLIPKDESKMNGRDGILAHTYMLGASGQSNGCVSFSDYSAFLDAYLRGDVTHLVVVEHLVDPPSPKTASDWLSNALKDMFRRS
jgi:hypothetical protein